MKEIFACITCFIMPILDICAEDSIMKGGKSPNNQYEVRIASDPTQEPFDYAIKIYTSNSNKSIYTLDGIGGYLRYGSALERCYALWHNSGEFVVISHQGTRHSRELYILAVSGKRVERLQFPDFVQNALGRVNATEIDLHCVSSPERWIGDDLCVTHYFSVSTPEKGRLFYTCEVILRLNYVRGTSPRMELKNVSSPETAN